MFVAVADAALGLLEREPAEPVILNLAGVACYELWSLDAAQALFRAARRLDPELPDIERNLHEVARRQRAAGRRTRPLHAAVPGLARRARSVAGRAQPATGLTLSLCMIVRDEEQMLPRCLAAVAPAVDEIVVVDTGSTDATVEIARSFGARVIERPWNGLVRRGAQRLLRRRHRRLAHVPGRRRDPRRRGRAPAARADRADLARGVLHRGDELPG